MTLRFCLACNGHHERGTTCKVRERRNRSKAERLRRSAGWAAARQPGKVRS
jgi:hypothetical protein